MDTSWVAGLENRFLEQGLLSVQSSRYMPPLEHLPSVMDTVLMGFEELIANKDKESVKDLQKLLARAATEVSNGVAWTGPRVEVIGRVV